MSQDSEAKRLIAAGLSNQSLHLKNQANAAYVLGDEKAASDLGVRSEAKSVDATLVHNSNLTEAEQDRLNRLQSEFNRWMDNGQEGWGGLTKPERDELQRLWEKTNSLG